MTLFVSLFEILYLFDPRPVTKSTIPNLSGPLPAFHSPKEKQPCLLRRQGQGRAAVYVCREGTKHFKDDYDNVRHLERFHRLRSRYYIRRLFKELRDYIDHCPMCAGLRASGQWTDKLSRCALRQEGQEARG